MTEYIERRHLQVSEKLEQNGFDLQRWWEASAQGPLIPSKIYVSISRTGSTAEEALNALNAAIEEQGWEVR